MRLPGSARRLADKPEIARLRGPGAETLLHIVARQWPKLRNGGEIDALVPHFDVGCTALHQAVSGGHLPIAELLVQRGARLDIDDDSENATPRE